MDIDFDLRAARDDDAEAISQLIVSALRESNASDYPPDIIERLAQIFSPAAVLDMMGKRKVFVATSDSGSSGPRVSTDDWFTPFS